MPAGGDPVASVPATGCSEGAGGSSSSRWGAGGVQAAAAVAGGAGGVLLIQDDDASVALLWKVWVWSCQRRM